MKEMKPECWKRLQTTFHTLKFFNSRYT